jgi:hypothetical protein
MYRGSKTAGAVCLERGETRISHKKSARVHSLRQRQLHIPLEQRSPGARAGLHPVIGFHPDIRDQLQADQAPPLGPGTSAAGSPTRSATQLCQSSLHSSYSIRRSVLVNHQPRQTPGPRGAGRPARLDAEDRCREPAHCTRIVKLWCELNGSITSAESSTDAFTISTDCRLQLLSWRSRIYERVIKDFPVRRG